MMGLKEKVFGRFKRLFGYTQGVSAGTAITMDLVNSLSTESRFDQMSYADVYEHIYTREPEIASAVDKIASYVARAYQGVYVRAGKKMEEDERKLQTVAQLVERKLGIRRWFEVIAGLLLIHGNAFVKIERSRKSIPTLRVLPNAMITVVDDKKRIGQFGGFQVIMDEKFVVINEGQLRYGFKEIVYPIEEVIHLRYKDIPVMVVDRLGRPTFGIYDISPLERVRRFVQWKRQLMMIDVMWRWRNVPREHHVISTDQFDLSKYTGTLEERRAKAQKDAEEVLRKYVSAISEKQPDQAYVTTDTVDIKTLETKTKYTEPNKLLEQIGEQILMALGVPESVVKGKSSGSYASEVVISNYLTAMIIGIAEKIRDALLPIVKEGVSKIDRTLPVEKLDMKIELVLDMNRMELFRQASIMVASGVFTPTEIRRFLGYDELTEGQMNEILSWMRMKDVGSGRKVGEKTVGDVVRDVRSNVDLLDPPDTPWSEEVRKSGGEKR